VRRACLPTYLPTYPPAYLPACLSAYLPACMPASLSLSLSLARSLARSLALSLSQLIGEIVRRDGQVVMLGSLYTIAPGDSLFALAGLSLSPPFSSHPHPPSPPLLPPFPAVSPSRYPCLVTISSCFRCFSRTHVPVRKRVGVLGLACSRGVITESQRSLTPAHGLRWPLFPRVPVRVLRRPAQHDSQGTPRTKPRAGQVSVVYTHPSPTHAACSPPRIALSFALSVRCRCAAMWS